MSHPILTIQELSAKSYLFLRWIHGTVETGTGIGRKVNRAPGELLQSDDSEWRFAPLRRGYQAGQVSSSSQPRDYRDNGRKLSQRHLPGQFWSAPFFRSNSRDRFRIVGLYSTVVATCTPRSLFQSTAKESSSKSLFQAKDGTEHSESPSRYIQ